MNDKDKITLLEMIAPQLALLRAGDLTESEGLFPTDFWATCPRGARTTFGRWIARLVRGGEIPLEPCDYTSSRHNRYRRK